MLLELTARAPELPSPVSGSVLHSWKIIVRETSETIVFIGPNALLASFLRRKPWKSGVCVDLSRGFKTFYVPEKDAVHTVIFTFKAACITFKVAYITCKVAYITFNVAYITFKEEIQCFWSSGPLLQKGRLQWANPYWNSLFLELRASAPEWHLQ